MRYFNYYRFNLITVSVKGAAHDVRMFLSSFSLRLVYKAQSHPWSALSPSFLPWPICSIRLFRLLLAGSMAPLVNVIFFSLFLVAVAAEFTALSVSAIVDAWFLCAPVDASPTASS